METPRMNCIIPHSLCMRPMTCEYCTQQNTCSVQIVYLFGILTCNTHRAWGIRDCNAYMHTHKIVRLRDAMKNVDIAECINYLRERDGTFIVTRTNGDRETGWSLTDDPYEILKCFDTGWAVHATNTQHTKYVPLIHFMDMPSFAEILEKALVALDAGIYRQDAEEQTLCGIPQEVTDTVTRKVCLLDGTVVRATP